MPTYECGGLGDYLQLPSLDERRAIWVNFARLFVSYTLLVSCLSLVRLAAEVQGDLTR
jgi:hypothetical protein